MSDGILEIPPAPHGCISCSRDILVEREKSFSTNFPPFVLQVNRRPEIEAVVLLDCCPMPKVEELHPCLCMSDLDGRSTWTLRTRTQLKQARACNELLDLCSAPSFATPPLLFFLLCRLRSPLRATVRPSSNAAYFSHVAQLCRQSIQWGYSSSPVRATEGSLRTAAAAVHASPPFDHPTA